MNKYLNYFDKNNKYIHVLVNDKEILKKYSELWNKIKGLIEKAFNSEPVYNDKYIKISIKIYNNRIYTHFHYNKAPKDNDYFRCISIILLDSIFLNSDKEYYPQILLEEFKYIIKNKIIANTTN